MAISLEEVLTGAIEMLDGAEGTVQVNKIYHRWACDIYHTIYFKVVQILQNELYSNMLQ